MTKQVKIVDLVDGDGFKLPPNFSTQFRDLQGGVEYLKDSADTITSELRTVGKKLNTHTTDLSKITTKVNEIDEKLNTLSKAVSDNFDKTSEVMNSIHTILRIMVDVVASDEKTKASKPVAKRTGKKESRVSEKKSKKNAR